MGKSSKKPRKKKTRSPSRHSSRRAKRQEGREGLGVRGNFALETARPLSLDAERRRRIRRMAALLLDHWPPQHWWPAQTPYEVVVGAVLTQNTAWSNVEKAVARLKELFELTPRAIMDAPVDELAEAIRPTGYYRLKAERLRQVTAAILKYTDDPDLTEMRRRPVEFLRRELIAVRGVGPETADSILLYALNKPVFVIDAYTRRILYRHGLIRGDESYDALQALMQEALPRQVRLYNELHAVIVATAKHHCQKRKVFCEACPLMALDRERPVCEVCRRVDPIGLPAAATMCSRCAANSTDHLQRKFCPQAWTRRRDIRQTHRDA